MSFAINWIDMAGVIPPGEQGVAKVEHLEVDAALSAFSSIRAAVTMNGDARVKEGRYAQLRVSRTLMMSDTQMERRSNTGLILNARGHVLVAGLGIGMVIPPLLARPEVTRVTVVEKYGDVIALVEPPLRQYLGDAAAKLEVVEQDIFDFLPPKGLRYDTVYFDIWPDICLDNLEEMERLHRRFARRKQPGAWMDSWQRTRLRDMKRRGGGWR